MANTKNKLSANDRKQLVKITEGRFNILRSAIKQRTNELRSEIHKEVQEEHASEIKDIRKKLVARARKEKENQERFNKRVNELAEELKEIEVEAADKGLRVKTSYNDEIGTVTPVDIDSIVDSRMKDIYGGQSEILTELKKKEFDVIEEISVAGIESDEAKDFLGGIPSIDTLLPPPQKAKELVK